MCEITAVQREKALKTGEHYLKCTLALGGFDDKVTRISHPICEFADYNHETDKALYIETWGVVIYLEEECTVQVLCKPTQTQLGWSMDQEYTVDNGRWDPPDNDFITIFNDIPNPWDMAVKVVGYLFEVQLRQKAESIPLEGLPQELDLTLD